MNEPLILDGKALARVVQADLQKRAAAVIARTGTVPVLATILVGDNPASVTYVKMKGNACKRVGIGSRKITLPAASTTDEVIATIEEQNNDPCVAGILLQAPLPPAIDTQRCFNSIRLDKDVDGVNTGNFGAMTMGLDGYKSATPLAIMSLLQHYRIPVSGQNAVVIGRSPILGKPVAMMLLNADATVTICHRKTQNLPDIVRRADIVVAAVGQPLFVQADWVREGAVIIDAGYNAGNIGDVDLANAAPKSGAYTPVPGGVGPVTIIKLIEQTVLAAERQAMPPAKPPA